jgi:hypothetical protein
MNMTDDTTITKALPSRDDEEASAALAAIYALVQDAGYERTKETVKLAEFVSPTGNILYLEKVRVSLNNIRCCVHPRHARESLMALDGVHAVSDAHRFHSNMTSFPKRLHGGRTPTAYGWQIKADTLLDFHRFLAAFASLPA